MQNAGFGSRLAEYKAAVSPPPELHQGSKTHERLGRASWPACLQRHPQQSMRLWRTTNGRHEAAVTEARTLVSVDRRPRWTRIWCRHIAFPTEAQLAPVSVASQPVGKPVHVIQRLGGVPAAAADPLAEVGPLGSGLRQGELVQFFDRPARPPGFTPLLA